MIGNKKIAVVMICKNEEGIVLRALNSVLPIADAFFIQDNGSTDNTEQVVLDWMQGKEGAVYSVDWVNFAHNRNDVLEVAVLSINTSPDSYGSLDDWMVLTLDADDQLVLDGSVQDVRLSKPEANTISLRYKLADLAYTRVSVVSDLVNWTWEGVVHEYLAYTGDKANLIHGELLGAHIVASASEGARSADPEKYLKDARALAFALEADPTNRRYQFYLARSYHDHYRMCAEPQWLNLSIINYERRATREENVPDPFEEERWYAEYMWASLTNNLDRMTKVVSQRPWRAEAALACSHIAEASGQPGTAYTYALLAVEAAKQNKRDILFVDSTAYGWAAYDRLGTIAFYAGFYVSGINAIDTCLNHPSWVLPQPDIDRMKTNRAFYSQKLLGGV